MGRKDFKQKFHKPTSIKVVTIWGLLPRAFNTSEFSSRKIRTSCFFSISATFMAILKHLFAASPFDFRTDST